MLPESPSVWCSILEWPQAREDNLPARKIGWCKGKSNGDEVDIEGKAWIYFKDSRLSLGRNIHKSFMSRDRRKVCMCRIIESLRSERPIRSSSPNHQPIPVTILDHVPQCNIFTFTEILQVW